MKQLSHQNAVLDVIIQASFSIKPPFFQSSFRAFQARLPCFFQAQLPVSRITRSGNVVP